jgi:uncharacterized SAM-binding protein YcdF (DUF218 family)
MSIVARLIAATAGLAALTLGAGFVAFLLAVHRQAALPPPADGIVVLTGGSDRIETGLHLLAAGEARLLLVSGVPRESVAELLHRAGIPEGPIAGRVTLGRQATTTLGNAEETSDWVHAHDIHTLVVVTAAFHMPRALLEIARALPGTRLYAMPVRPAPGHAVSIRTLLAEYVKLIAAWAGASHLMRQPIATVLHHPVDNSVSG